MPYSSSFSRATHKVHAAEGGVVPGPTGPLTRGSRLKGTAAFSQTHGPPGDRGAAPSGLSLTQLSSTRNSQLLPPPPHPPSVSLAAPPRTGDPRIPGDDASVVSQGGRGSFGLLSSASFFSCQGEDKKSNESRTVHGSRGTRRGRWGSALGSHRGSPQVAAAAVAGAAAAGAVAAAAGSGSSEWRTGRRV